jgi:hypothetical protein
VLLVVLCAWAESGGGSGAGGVKMMPAFAETANANSIAETLIAFIIILFLIGLWDY